jgi:hypothetical protein
MRMTAMPARPGAVAGAKIVAPPGITRSQEIPPGLAVSLSAWRFSPYQCE